ncbi:SAM-dependent methyltransferase [Halobacteriales archaeon QS_1_68_17]|nr:MAG: SAM-dependent methyltransferase [Halobacteriales archaeon QS_1_68_17]
MSEGDGRPANRGAVAATYDRIADHFARTRVSAWPEVEQFLSDRPPVETALDVGCGNGRHAELLASLAGRVVCLDASRGVLSTAMTRCRDAPAPVAYVQGDAAALPLADDAAGLAVYVATIHHLPDRDLRVRSLDELARVLAPGGRALVSAWSTTHDRFDADPDATEGFDTTVDWTLPGGETVGRYYHIYAPAEFEADLAASRLAVVEAFVSSGNCYAVVGPPG